MVRDLCVGQIVQKAGQCGRNPGAHQQLRCEQSGATRVHRARGEERRTAAFTPIHCASLLQSAFSRASASLQLKNPKGILLWNILILFYFTLGLHPSGVSGLSKVVLKLSTKSWGMKLGQR
ncbi:hypothetical protein CHARACLAT_007626 [Characodon lateralis]|uniref:Uncharacterized protein n=1 Tax=Characodon lateralis TaxID=208331 RepID=A0ABU7DYM0_9TELE|nr:hypothetical protein [Characodon lateralis]